MIEYILLAFGIAFLIKGADFLVEGSSSLAKKLGISSLVIGLTVMAFGTSMPELVVNVISAINGTGDIAFGNILGSNMANILLILGLTAFITTLDVQYSTTWKEIPFSFLAILVLLVFSSIFLLDDLNINSLLRMEGIILILFFAVFLYYVFESARKSKKLNNIKPNTKKTKIKMYSNPVIFLLILGGSIGLYLGGKWTVEGAVTIAQGFGLSEFLISATVIAIGTSLPELITSVTAAMRKNVDLAVGNIVGSNIFNIFWVLGLTSIITPIPFPQFIISDLLILLFVTFLLFIFMFIGRKHQLEKWQGGLFVILYVAYIAFLIIRG